MFQNSKPLVVELACGKGEYTVGLAREFPDKNFVGMDIKGARMYVGAQTAIQENLTNVAFLRGKIENLRSFFGWQEIDELWITFPDPRPKDRDEKKRLTSPRFLQLYQHVVKPGGLIHLKTDNRPLADYTGEILTGFGAEIEVITHDLYQSPYAKDHHGIKTYFEEKFTAKGFLINYLRFQLPPLVAPLGPIPPVYFENENPPVHQLEQD